ncbi:MAG: hypothetical protein ACHQX3_03730, partial [Nitrospirales bacterium]
MPNGGLNFVDGPLEFPPKDAYMLDNLVPRSFGLEIRKGWRYWYQPPESTPEIKVPAFPGFEVRT